MGGAIGSIKDGIVLDQLPMAPSENSLYATDWNSGRRFPSQELKEYKSRMQAWSMSRMIKLGQIMNELKWELADHRKAIRVDSYMFFQYDSLFTKPTTSTERPRRKKMDPSNRAKALYDCLGVMLGIDDSRLVPGEILPIHRTDPRGQFIMVRLKLTMIQTDEEFQLENSLYQLPRI